MNNNSQIFILNLDRSIDRKKIMVDQFKSIGIKNYNFMPAFDGRFMSNMTLNANIGMGYGAGRQFQKAELGIIMSHLAIYKFAMMMDYDDIIILEDDVILCNDWDERLKWLKEHLPENWEFTYLSGHSDYVKFKKYETRTIIHAPKMVGAFSYMINKPAYSKIINYCSSFMTTIDDMIMHMISEKRMVGYAYFPFMTFHNANDSYVWSETPGHISHKNNMHSSFTYFKNKI